MPGKVDQQLKLQRLVHKTVAVIASPVVDFSGDDISVMPFTVQFTDKACATGFGILGMAPLQLAKILVIL
jgi:hypothetical protein